MSCNLRGHCNPGAFPTDETPENLTHLRRETELDPQLSVLKTMIVQRLPEDIKCSLPATLMLMKCLCKMVIVIGKCIDIPQSTRAEMKKGIHSAHMGINGSIRRVGEKLFLALDE